MISISDPISHGNKGALAECGRVSVYEYPCVDDNNKNITPCFRKVSVLERFFDDFAAEIDILGMGVKVTDRVLSLREGQLRKITPEFRRVCARLKDLGLSFKIKWPIEIGGRMKFADVYFPRQRTVLMLTNAMALIGRPHWMLSDRAEFFRPHFRVVEVETLAELERKMSLKASMAKKAI